MTHFLATKLFLGSPHFPKNVGLRLANKRDNRCVILYSAFHQGPFHKQLKLL